MTKKISDASAQQAPSHFKSGSKEKGIIPEPKSFWQKRLELRTKKKLDQIKISTAEAKFEEQQKRTEEKAEEKAKQEFMKDKSLDEVQETINKSHKKRSHPVATLLLLAMVVGLSGSLVWMYREQKVIDQQNEISGLRQSLQSLEQQKQTEVAATSTKEAMFQDVTTDNYSIRIPKDWVKQPSRLPSEETIYGNSNVILRIVRSDSRNSIKQFIPEVDYLWQISNQSGNTIVTNQSLHCQRFDTIDNNLSDKVREHNGFHVYCNTDAEKSIIAALSAPDKYGLENTGVYFVVEINDTQQASLQEIKNYIESYKTH